MILALLQAGEKVPMPSIHIICFTQRGHDLSQKIRQLLPCDNDISVNFCSRYNSEEYIPLDEWSKKYFKKESILVFIGACGIAVRAVAPYIKNKAEDAGVIVIDEMGKFVIPVLSGHLGGANEYTVKIASLIGGIPVLTTATDVNNFFAVDVFAKNNNLAIEDLSQIKAFSSALLQEKSSYIAIDDTGWFDSFCDVSEDIHSVSTIPDTNADNVCLISALEKPSVDNYSIHLIPKCLAVGIGCRKGKSYKDLKDFVEKVFRDYNLSLQAVSEIASIDIKKAENCILQLAEDFNVPYRTFSAQELLSVRQKCSSSDFVRQITGVDNVCERSVYACGAISVIVPKTAFNGMTISIGIKKICCKSVQGEK